MPVKIHSTILAIAISIILLPIFIYINGCDDAGILTTNTDSNVVVYKNLVLTLLFNDSTGSVLQAANLWTGQVVAANSNVKDIYLSRPANDPNNSFFNSGHLYPGFTGMQTKFNLLYQTLDSQSKFDSLSMIPVDTLDPNYFVAYSTAGWGNFTINQASHPVFSFYLEGKYAGGQTNGNRIYGVFYVKSVISVNSPPNIGVQVTIDVKYNKIGANHFKP